MSERVGFALQVIRVQDIVRNETKRFYVEVRLDRTVGRTGFLSDDGEPAWNGTLTFPNPIASDTFRIDLKESLHLVPDHLVGRVEISVVDLLKKSAENKARLDLSSVTKARLRQETAQYAGNIHLYCKMADAMTRAQIEVDMTENSTERMRNRVNRSVYAINSIDFAIHAVDRIIDAVDKAAAIYRIFQLSWRMASTLFKLVSDQFEKDKSLVDMVDKMRRAFDFTVEANSLDSVAFKIKPLLQELLAETIECSRLVRQYASHGFIVRMLRIPNGQKIDEYATYFSQMRNELNSVITLGTAKTVVDIQFQQQLEGLERMLNPALFDVSGVSNRPRCLHGTREEYLGPTMDFLFLEAVQNILWLSGAAGSGKSTIAVTIADRCEERGCPVVYMFFERERSECFSVIRTLAYKLATVYPSILPRIAAAVDRNKNIQGSTLEHQFRKLFLEPILATEHMESPIIIILDALDECGSVEQRRDLLELLKTEFSKLPLKVRILVTCRPENDIMKSVSTKGHIRHVELNHTSHSSHRDVELYIRKEMEDAIDCEVQRISNWDRKMQMLSLAADGLFVWASTAVRMVRNSDYARRKLDTLLDNVTTVGIFGIDSLCARVLEASGISWDDPESTTRFIGIVGFVLVSKEAFSDSAIEEFLGLEAETAGLTLRRLRSVLFYEPGRPVRFHHASFVDYISSERSAGKPWNIEVLNQNLVVTERCLCIMDNKLRFNICDIRTSFVHNRDIPGIEARIQSEIPPYLRYACRFWSYHMQEIPQIIIPTTLLEKLNTFLDVHLLYWFEVLSLTERFKLDACRVLMDITTWIAPVNRDISSLLWDAYKLASIFAYPISQSIAHIYLSAISLWQGLSRTADHYSRIHPTIQIYRSGSKPSTRCIRLFEGHKGLVMSVAFSPNGSRIASGSRDRTIRIWDAESRELVAGALHGHHRMVTCVAFSGNGRCLALGSDDWTIRIWDVDSGELISGPFHGHKDVVNSVSFSCDSKQVVSGSADNTIRIWDAFTGKLVIDPIEGHTSWVQTVAFSPDGGRIVSGSYDEAVRIWNSSDGSLAPGPLRGHTSEVTSVAFSPDGLRIVSGSGDRTIRVWSAINGRPISLPFEGHTGCVESVAFSPDGESIVSGSDDKSIRIWNAHDGGVISGPFEGHTDWIRSVMFSPDGRRLVSGADDGTVRIWDTSDNQHDPSSFNGHTEIITSIACSPTKNRIVTGSTDRTARIWDLESGQVISILEHVRLVTSVTFSSNGTYVALNSHMGPVAVWDFDIRTVVRTSENHRAWILSVEFSRDGRCIVAGQGYGNSRGSVYVWYDDAEPSLLGPYSAHTDEVSSIVFSPNRRCFITGYDWNLGYQKYYAHNGIAFRSWRGSHFIGILT